MLNETADEWPGNTSHVFTSKGIRLLPGSCYYPHDYQSADSRKVTGQPANLAERYCTDGDPVILCEKTAAAKLVCILLKEKCSREIKGLREHFLFVSSIGLPPPFPSCQTPGIML